MAIGAANRAVAVFLDEFDTALVLALARPAIEYFDCEYVLERRLLRVMLAEADVRASGMTWHCDTAHPGDFVDHFLRRQMHVGKIEAAGYLAGHAEDEHMAVVGFDFGGLEHENAEAIFERAVVRVFVELPMLGQHDTVDGAFGAAQLEPVQVGFQWRATVLRSLAMAVQVKDGTHSAQTSPRRAEFRESDLGRHVVEHDLDGHPYSNLFGRAVDNVREHFEALVEFDVGHHIGQRFAEAGRAVLVGDGEGVDFASTFALDPFGVRRKTIRAERARMVAHIAAVAALLDVKLMALERLPPRAALLVDVRQRLRVSLLCFFLRHFYISLILSTRFFETVSNY